MGMWNRQSKYYAEGHQGDVKLEVFASRNGKYSSVGLDLSEHLPRKQGRATAKTLSIRCPLDPETSVALGLLLVEWGRELKEVRDADGS